jgi:hypothetical protein
MQYSKARKEKFAKDILARIELGEPVRRILLEKKMPSSSTFFRWLVEDEELAKRYAHACDLRSEMKFESIEADYLEEPQRDLETGKIDMAWVALQRLKIDSKKWELAKLNPSKFGDKNTTVLEGGDKPIQIDFTD